MKPARFGPLAVDIESLVRSQDIVCETAPACWQDGLLLGNGDVGAVAYAPYWLEWTVNKVDVFDGRMAPKQYLTHREVMRQVQQRGAKDLKFLSALEPVDPNYRGPLEPRLKSCGQIKIRTRGNEFSWGAPPPYQVRQALSLWDGQCRMAMRLNRPESHPRVDSFVARQQNVLVIRMTGCRGPMWRKRIELCRPYDGDLREPAWGSDSDCVWFRQDMPDGSAYAMAMAAVSTSTKRPPNTPVEPGIAAVTQQGDRIGFELNGDMDLFIAVASSREDAEPLARAVNLARAAARQGVANLQREHRRWWRAFWRRSFIQLDDPLVEQLWYTGLYHLASTYSRAPIPGLFGLAYGFHDLPVQSFFHAIYTLDQNVQMPIMPLFGTNHADLAEPFLDVFLNALPKTIERTRRLFELPGACFGLEMTFDGREPPFGSEYRYSLCGGLYSGLIFAWAYRYNPDRQLLADTVYPFLREIVRFFTALMRKESDGRYHMPPTIPAEIGVLSRDAIADLSLLRPCLTLAIEAAESLGVDAEDRRHWRDVLNHYPDYPAGNGVLLDGRDVPYDVRGHDTYRLYPLVLAHDECDSVRHLVRRTLDYVERHYRSGDRWQWSTDGQDYFKGNGWQWLFFALAKIHCGPARHVMPLIHEMIRSRLKCNGQMPQLSLGREITDHPRYRELTAGLTENHAAVVMVVTAMLLQSHNGLIRLFPGLTRSQGAVFGDLRAEGAFLVSSEMNKGKVRFVSIRAEQGGTARILNPWKGKTVTLVRERGRQEKVQGKIITLPLKKNETILLVSGAKPKVRRIVSARLPCPKTKAFKDGTIVSLGKSWPTN